MKKNIPEFKMLQSAHESLMNEDAIAMAQMYSCYEIAGIIMGVTAAPIDSTVDEWMPMIFSSEAQPNFKTSSLAVDFATAAIEFFNACKVCYQNAVSPIPVFTFPSLQDENEFADALTHGITEFDEEWDAIFTTDDSEEPCEEFGVHFTLLLLLQKLGISEENESADFVASLKDLPDQTEIKEAIPALIAQLGFIGSQHK